MKKLLLFFGILFFTCTVYGQSYNSTNTSNKRDIVPYRPNTVFKYDSFNLNKLTGFWESLDGLSILRIYRSNNKYLVTGNYFPGVTEDGDKAILEKIKFGGKYQLDINYTLGLRGGGGGAQIVYYPKDDHIIVGYPPHYVVDKNGKVGVESSMSSSGIYGKEFKHMK